MFVSVAYSPELLMKRGRNCHYKIIAYILKRSIGEGKR
jgi:hypothetical protein